VTDQTTAPSNDNAAQPGRRGFPIGRTLAWLGIAGASAALTFFVLRATVFTSQAPSDETTDRIQALIDEANRLIKTLDEKKQA